LLNITHDPVLMKPQTVQFFGRHICKLIATSFVLIFAFLLQLL